LQLLWYHTSRSIEAFGKPNLPKWVAPFGTALQSTE
jgi:hypothetical protein